MTEAARGVLHIEGLYTLTGSVTFPQKSELKPCYTKETGPKVHSSRYHCP